MQKTHEQLIADSARRLESHEKRLGEHDIGGLAKSTSRSVWLAWRSRVV